MFRKNILERKLIENIQLKESISWQYCDCVILYHSCSELKTDLMKWIYTLENS